MIKLFTVERNSPCHVCGCCVCFCFVETETDLEQWFTNLVTLLGGKARKLIDDGNRGFPDRTVFLCGEIRFFEFKNPDGSGKLSKHQYKTIKELRDSGYRVYEIDQPRQAIAILGHWIEREL